MVESQFLISLYNDNIRQIMAYQNAIHIMFTNGFSFNSHTATLIKLSFNTSAVIQLIVILQ